MNTKELTSGNFLREAKYTLSLVTIASIKVSAYTGF
jgi:hypothetical protein